MPIWWWSIPAVSSIRRCKNRWTRLADALAENGKVIVTGVLGAKAEGQVIRDVHPKMLAVTGPHATVPR